MVAPERRRGRPPDEEARSKRREEILGCAARVFAAGGYQTTDVQAIADAANVAKGTLYLYFTGKEELFLAAVDQGMTSLRAIVDAALEGVRDPLQVFERGILAYLRFFEDHPEQVELLIQERAEFRDHRQSTYFRHREQDAAHWHALLAELLASGRFRDLPLTRIDDVMNDLVYGTMFTNHFSGRHKPIETQAADILDIVFRGILSDDERARMRDIAS